jgi:hypothetical protein
MEVKEWAGYTQEECYTIVAGRAVLGCRESSGSRVANPMYGDSVLDSVVGGRTLEEVVQFVICNPWDRRILVCRWLDGRKKFGIGVVWSVKIRWRAVWDVAIVYWVTIISCEEATQAAPKMNTVLGFYDGVLVPNGVRDCCFGGSTRHEIVASI